MDNNEVQNIISNIDTSDIDLSDYAKKSEVYTKSQTYSKSEIDTIIGDINTILNNILYIK